MTQLEDNTQRKITLEQIEKLNRLLQHRKSLLRKLNQCGYYAEKGEEFKIRIDFGGYNIPVDIHGDRKNVTMYSDIWNYLVGILASLDEQLEEIDFDTSTLSQIKDRPE